MTQINLTEVSITYSQPLIQSLNICISQGWTGITGPNGCGKTSLAAFICSSLVPGKDEKLPGDFSGTINGPASLCYLPQIPTPEAESFYDLFYASDNTAQALVSRLELKEEWIDRIDDLSMGQKRRIQIAQALSSYPEVLILDEPENHLDKYSKDLTIQILSEYRGIGIIIGHSRDIMNSLCASTLLIYQGKWHWYQSPLSDALKLYRQEEDSIRKQRHQLVHTISAQNQVLHKLKAHSKKSEKSLSKRGISRHDHDKKSAVDLARISGADKTSSRKAALQRNRIDSTMKKLSHLENDKIWKLGVTIGGNRSHLKNLCRIDAGFYEIHDDFGLYLPDFTINPGDRIMIRGKNGCGKTSLLDFISKRLPVPLLYQIVPQELSRKQQTILFEDFKTLDNARKAEALSSFSRMGSNPQQLYQEMQVSPGEIKKLLLSMIFLKDTELLILDEPANHLDIFTIEVLEEALERYPGAVLMVSHEESFCRSVINREWHIEEGRLHLKML